MGTRRGELVELLLESNTLRVLRGGIVLHWPCGSLPRLTRLSRLNASDELNSSSNKRSTVSETELSNLNLKGIAQENLIRRRCGKDEQILSVILSDSGEY